MHPVYMAKKPLPKKSQHWRPNHFRLWRDFRGLTQQQVEDALAAPPYNIELTRNSVSRIENAKQRPQIELIEALAKIYRTDVDSLLTRPPEASQATPPATAQGLLQLWDQAAPQERGLIIEVAKRFARG